MCIKRRVFLGGEETGYEQERGDLFDWIRVARQIRKARIKPKGLKRREQEGKNHLNEI